MMYLKQFPDICREMGFDVEEKAKTIIWWAAFFRNLRYNYKLQNKE